MKLMNRFIFSFVLMCSFAVGVFAQDDDIILTIDGREISKAEFEYIYKKNNNNVFSEADKKSPKEYMDLFIDFKLKVIEAENLKMDTSKTFTTELAGYRKEVAAPYLTDTNYDEQLVREMYRRMTKEVDASHILLRLEPNASAAKEAEVLAKANSIRGEILAGKDFGEAAVEYSEDPSAKENKGHLGYFSAFMMVYPFENAAFETPVGEISEPVRSKFGYHLVKVNDMRDNKGEILVAQIMKAVPRDASAETRKAQKDKINAVYKQLQNGADFAELAKTESDDRQSAAKGGEMPWFAAGRIIPEFSDAAFAIKNTGDYTEPIETPFGYHIIKKLDERPIAPFDELKHEIEGRIKRDAERNNSSEHVFIAKLKENYQFAVNEENKAKLEDLNIADIEQLNNDVLFSIDGENFTGADFSAWAKSKKIAKVSALSVFDQWTDDEILALEDAKLENKYPEFRFLMKEYHDGILLFNISQEKIWNFASQDSVGLQAFYEKNKENHLWEERFKGEIITCTSPEVHEQADNLFGAGMNVDEVRAHLNTNKEVITEESGAWERGENPIVDYYVWNGPEPENFNSETVYVRGDKVEPEPKNMNEARGLYISDYQKYLEEIWLKELHKKYKIKINKKLLKTVDAI